jgi:hypothetical protein
VDTDPSTWNAATRVIAVLAGVVFGSAAISSACWVWVRRQIFAYGGSALCGSGVILLGLSIWHSVEFGISGTGMTLKMQADLAKQLQLLNEKETALAVQTNNVRQLLATIDEEKAKLEENLKASQDARKSTFAAAQATAQLASSVATTSKLVAEAIAQPSSAKSALAVKSANTTVELVNRVIPAWNSPQGNACVTVLGGTYCE